MAKKNTLTTPSKYDSIIVAEYERYKEDCGLKIGDHKILCKVFDAQDDNLKDMLAQGYDVQAKVITDLVREMLTMQAEQIAEYFEVQKKAIFAEIGTVKTAVEELKGDVQELRDRVESLANVVDCTKSEVDMIKNELKKLKVVNSWWHITGRWVSGVVTAVLIAWYLFKTYWSN